MASNGRARAEKRSHAAITTTTALLPSTHSNHTSGVNKQARLSRAHQTVNTRTALTDISNRTQQQHDNNNNHSRKADNHSKEQTEAAAKPVTRSHSRTNDRRDKENKQSQPSHHAAHLKPQPAKPLRRSSRSAASNTSASTSSALQHSYSLSDSTFSESEHIDDSRLDDSYAQQSDDSAVYDQQEDEEDEEEERLDDSQDGREKERQSAQDAAVEKLHTDSAARPLSPSLADADPTFSSSSSPLPFPAHLPRSRFINGTNKSNGTSTSSPSTSASTSTHSAKLVSSIDYTRRVYEPANPSASEQSAACQRWLSSAQFKPDYSTSIFHHLLSTERQSLPSPSYMDDVQGDLSFPMRAILVDWLVEVAEEYHLQPQTLWLCIAYVDRFLALQPVDRSRLQLVGVVCMLVAAKYWEIYPPTIDDFVYISDHTYDKQQVLSMERSVLQALRFQLTVPTAWEFGRRLHSLCGMSAVEGHLMEYVMEAFMQEKDLLDWTPSIIAVSAAYLALSTIGRPTSVSSLLSEVSGYDYRDVKECVRAMWSMHVRVCVDRDGVIAVGTQGMKAVKDKYASGKWSEVSKIKPRANIAEIK